MAMTSEWVEYAGADQDLIRAQLFVPHLDGEPRGGLVLAHDVDEDLSTSAKKPTQALAEALAGAGYVCLLPDLWSHGLGSRGDSVAEADKDGERWSREERLPERRALEDLDRGLQVLAARDDLRSDSIGVVGLRSGGCLAFLVGCTSRHVALVVGVGGRALYPELSANKPTQPLELLLNLDRPFLGLWGGEDPDLPAAQRELWRQKLDAGGKDSELVVYPGAAPTGLAAASGEPLDQILRFLDERL